MEPGYCTGSVIYIDQCYGINVDHCRLYGSGTYGLETYDSGDIKVNDTDIYDCTYGIVDLYRTNSIEFHRCKMYNSKEFSIFNFTECWNVLFEECDISGNKVELSDWNFIQNNDSYSVTFKNCRFTDNEYSSFSEGEVNLENCTVLDNG